MTSTLYTSRELIEVIAPLDRPQQFLTSVFFPGVDLFDSERIDFHELNISREVAQFVHPDASAPPRGERGSKIDSFDPAYLRELTPVKPSTNLSLRPGEIYGGNLTPQQRRTDRIMQITADHEAMIMRRVELMSATILKAGAITITGPDYPTNTVDFGRTSGLTKALTGGARWGESGVSPTSNLRAWANEVAVASGAAVDTAVMGGEAFEIMLKEQDFKDRLDNRRQASGELEMFQPPKGQDAWGTYQGSVGNVDYWTYSQPYAINGVAGNMMGDNDVIFGSRQQHLGTVAYGAILDDEALIAATYWPKMFNTHNPSRLFIESSAAPMPVPVRVDAVMFAQVR